MEAFWVAVTVTILGGYKNVLTVDIEDGWFEEDGMEGWVYLRWMK